METLWDRAKKRERESVGKRNEGLGLAKAKAFIESENKQIRMHWMGTFPSAMYLNTQSGVSFLCIILPPNEYQKPHTLWFPLSISTFFFSSLFHLENFISAPFILSKLLKYLIK